jgi:hypothetical protein
MSKVAYPNPVFDPGIPEPARAVLAANEHLLPSPSAMLRRPRLGGRDWRVFGRALVQSPLWVYLPILPCWHFGRWAKVAGVAGQVAVAAPIAFAGMEGLAFNTVIGVPLQGFAFLTLVTVSGEPELSKLIRRYHGMYIRPCDLDIADRALLGRAQTAVDAVFTSHVHREGLLDEVHNTVLLPQQLWEIAQTLAEVSRLRARHVKVTTGLETQRVSEALRPRRKALEVATASITKRIETLEGYAARALAADQALLELRALRELDAGSEDYRALLARTVQDEMALAEIDDLTDRARVIEETLHANVEEAREAGLSLLPKAS